MPAPSLHRARSWFLALGLWLVVGMVAGLVFAPLSTAADQEECRSLFLELGDGAPPPELLLVSPPLGTIRLPLDTPEAKPVEPGDPACHPVRAPPR